MVKTMPTSLIKGVDVSQHNGAIDWGRTKRQIDFAMLRAGFGKGNIDKTFHANARACTTNGIPFGVYWFSYATTEEEAKAEADYCLKAVKGYSLSYPIAFDYEYDSDKYAKKQGKTLSKKKKALLAKAFCERIESGGYYAMIYSNLDYYKEGFESITPRFDLWYANWGVKSPDIKCGIWQASDKGIIAGINGLVDINFAYKNYPKIIGEMKPNSKAVSGAKERQNNEQIKEQIKEMLWKNYIAVANDVIAGKYGNGDARITALKKAGFSPAIVQSIVNLILEKNAK